MQSLSPDTQATLLLVNRLGGSEVKPLTPGEYARLARELHARGLRPADLIRGAFDGYPVEPRRLEALMSRGAALALTIERWAQAGLRVVSRSEPQYPQLLKAKLRSSGSPLIFYSGQLDILDAQAICIVGSRDPTEAGLAFAQKLGSACAEQGFAVVSGDARGVDRTAMAAALEHSGVGVGVVAESLLAAALSRRNRDQILANRLLLLSPYDPEARFTVAQAMDRNRYLYALSVAAVVVDSDTRGGTWSGAVENLKQSWTPAFVRVGQDVGTGNLPLVELGLTAIDDGDPVQNIQGLVDQGRKASEAAREPGLPFDSPAPVAALDATKPSVATELYRLFVSSLRTLLESGPCSETAVAERFELELAQADRWLAKAAKDGLIRRSAREVRL